MITLTETGLIDALASELERLFYGVTYASKSGNNHEVRIFRQYIPQPSGLSLGGTQGLKGYAEADYEANFPCIVVKHTEHTDREERKGDQSITGIKLLYGVYDKEPECEGWRDILGMIDRTRAEFLVNRIVAQIYVLNMPMKSRLLETETWPVYFGETDMLFTTGRPVMGHYFVMKGGGHDGNGDFTARIRRG